MKAIIICIFAVLAVLATSTNALNNKPGMKPLPKNFKYDVARRVKVHPASNFDGCGICVNVMSQGINQLLNVILNLGVIGSCNQLCGYLEEYGQLAVTGCNLACDYVGIELFIKAIEKADLDPIWLCEEIKICPVHDCTLPTCATFNNTLVDPTSAPKETVFHASSVLEIFDLTGTGEIIFEVLMPTGDVLGGGELVPKGFQKGVYDIRFDIETNDQPGDPPIEFIPGTYKVGVVVCQGMCGSSHSHSRRLADTYTSFKIV